MKQDSIQTGLCNEEKNMADSGRIEKKKDRQTNQADMGQKRRSHRMNITALLIFLFLFIGCSLLQFANNRQNAQKSCGLMLDQMKELITEDERSFQQLEDTLKEEYTIRANIAADYIAHGWEDYKEADDFVALAKLLGVDEVHVFDEKGKIINGSVPKYYGFTMDSGEQIGFFKPMLSDHTLSLCQDVTPNTAEGKPMMYAMVWAENDNALVQIGVTPDRLLEWMQNSDISKIVGRLPLVEGMSIYVVENATGTVLAATNDDILGYEIFPEDRIQDSLEEGKRYQKTVSFQSSSRYVVYEKMGEYDILVSYKIRAANKTLPLSMAEFALILIAALLLLTRVTRSYINYLERQGRELRTSNIAKTDFLRRMSHDIRTPLNGIRGVTAIAEYYADDMEKQAECRHKVMQASGFLMELVNNVLNMNKLESGEMKPENKPFDLIELLTETASIVEMQGQEYAIHFQMQMGKHKYRHLIGSPLYLKQVLQNIGGNAVKYNRAGGTVTFASEDVSYSDGRAVIKFTCTDTGRGMSREFLVHAFEPFSQENTDARTTFTGTGLGLAITKQMVELMEGTISLKSEQNVGTTISVTIPFRIDVDYTEPQEDAKPADAASLEGVHVLLVEDNELNMEIAEFLLKKAGITVTTAYNGQEAVDVFRTKAAGTFDVILMDVMMPVMDGLTAAREIHATNRVDAAEIPIFAMTANAFYDDVRQSREAGMVEHLSKPIQEQELLDAIRRHVKR